MSAKHPVGTTYDVLVPAHAARCRRVDAAKALETERYMLAEGLDPIIVAHLPDGSRDVGCLLDDDWLRPI